MIASVAIRNTEGDFMPTWRLVADLGIGRTPVRLARVLSAKLVPGIPHQFGTLKIPFVDKLAHVAHNVVELRASSAYSGRKSERPSLLTSGRPCSRVWPPICEASLLLEAKMLASLGTCRLSLFGRCLGGGAWRVRGFGARAFPEHRSDTSPQGQDR